MPTSANVEPVAPGAKRTPSEMVAFGRNQWKRKWKIFASQWSQPGLLKIAKETLGDTALHSSQIHGWSTGQLRDPAPKVIVAVGQLNLAIAAANTGTEADLPPHHPTCPMTLIELWKGKKWMTDAEGRPLGAMECFAALSGLLDLGLDDRSVSLTEKNMKVVSKAVGRYLRFALMEQGIDVMEVANDSRVVNRLVWGKEVTAAELEDSIQKIADEAKTSVDEVWDQCLTPALAELQ